MHLFPLISGLIFSCQEMYFKLNFILRIFFLLQTKTILQLSKTLLLNPKKGKLQSNIHDFEIGIKGVRERASIKDRN